MNLNRLQLVEAIETRLEALPDTTPETKGYLEKPEDVPRLNAVTQVVQRYWVLHPWWGRPSDETDLAERFDDLEWTFQITVAAGLKRSCLDLAFEVDGLLHHWTPVIGGHALGELRPPEGYDPGPPREDDGVKPSRWWLPLQYRTRISAHLSA